MFGTLIVLYALCAIFPGQVPTWCLPVAWSITALYCLCWAVKWSGDVARKNTGGL